MRSLKLRVAFVSWALALCAAACGSTEEPKPGANGANNTGATGNTGNQGSGNEGNQNEGGSGNTGNQGDGGGDEPGTTAGSGPEPGDACGAAWDAEAPEPSVACDMDNLTDAGTLSGDITTSRTLESGNSYVLSGPTRVMPGVTLTIQPCVKIIGEDPTAVLVAMAGNYDDAPGGAPTAPGKLEAVGEPNAPIVFTSGSEPGNRRPGDWGGIMLLGNAQHNAATRTANVVTRPTIEGLTSATPYGWDTADYNDQSSGSLAYVRIEYASRELAANEETNGLTFGAVGSGTTVHHVMVSNSNDDCFEWFGGTVSASHLIAYNCDDDMFDADRGFSGKIQFAFGRQIEGTLETDSNGFELDNGSNITLEPQTTAQWSNITLCGTKEEPTSAAGNAPRVGMAFRSGVGGAIMNALVTGFDNGGMFVTNEVEDLITITHSSVYDNVSIYNTASHMLGTMWFQSQEGNSIDKPSGMCDCFADPPLPFPRASVEGVAPAGFEDAEAAYQGAFADSRPNSNWMAGAWVDWSNE